MMLRIIKTFIFIVLAFGLNAQIKHSQIKKCGPDQILCGNATTGAWECRDKDELVASLETLTSLVYDDQGHMLTYTDEDGAVWNIGLNKGTITYAPLNNQLVYIDEAGFTTVLDLGSSIITQVVTTGNEIATHKGADGTATSIIETITGISLTDSIITYIDESGNGTPLNLKPLIKSCLPEETITSLDSVSISNGDITIYYTAEDGTQDVVSATLPVETLTTLVLADSILTYTDELGDDNAINFKDLIRSCIPAETITSISIAGDTITYIDENGDPEELPIVHPSITVNELTNSQGLDSTEILVDGVLIGTSNDTDTWVTSDTANNIDGTVTHTIYNPDGSLQSEFTACPTCITVDTFTNIQGGDSIVVSINGDVFSQTDTWVQVDTFTNSQGLDSVVITDPSGNYYTFNDTGGGGSGSSSSIVETVGPEGERILTHDNGSGTTVQFCEGIATFTDHHGVKISTKDILFDEDFYFNPTNEDPTGLGTIAISGADFSDDAIINTTNHNTRGVVNSKTSDATADMSFVVSSQGTDATGVRSFGAASLDSEFNGIISGGIGTRRTIVNNTNSFAGGGDNNTLSGARNFVLVGNENNISGPNSGAASSIRTDISGTNGLSLNSVDINIGGVSNGSFSSVNTWLELGTRNTAISSVSSYNSSRQNSTVLGSNSVNIDNSNTSVSFISSNGNNTALANDATQGYFKSSTNSSAQAGSNLEGISLNAVEIGGYNGMYITDSDQSRFGGLNDTIINANRTIAHLGTSYVQDVNGGAFFGALHRIVGTGGGDGLFVVGLQNTIESLGLNTQTAGVGGFGNTVENSPQSFTWGQNNTQSGSRNSIALGSSVSNTHQATISLSANDINGLPSQANNSINMSAFGGYTLFTNAPNTVGASLGSGATAWAAISARKYKDNFKPINYSLLYSMLLNKDIETWTYKGQTRRHIGMMADDFYELAGYGITHDLNQEKIETIDADGLQMALIKSLQNEIENLKKRIDEIENK